MRAKFATSDLMDAHPDAPCCDTQFRIWGKRRFFSGRIRTVRCLEDNVLVKKLFSQASDGDVLVVDGAGSLHCALMGDVIAALGMRSGWAGAIINGAVRDSVALDTLEFGVKALGTNPRRSGKRGEGAIDVPVCFGGATFVPGHYLYSDEDGIVILAGPVAI
ncbi:MAG: ribonuclease E activity regulator RraA [Terriglobales bacterium]